MAEDEKQGDVRTIAKECALIIDCNRETWRNIALRLDRSLLYKMMCAWKWFATVVMDDILWKELLLRDLRVTMPVGGDLICMEDGISWKETYASVFKPPPSYNPLYVLDHLQIAGARLGGLIMSPSVWVGELDLDYGEGFTTWTLKKHGIYVPNLLPGLWVADAYYALCPACVDANCGWTKTTLSLWHSKLHLLEGFEDFCPNTVNRKYTLSCTGIIVDESADDMDLAKLYSPGLKISGLNLEYNMSEKGIEVKFLADSMFDGKEYETEFRLTRDGGNRVVAIQIEHIVRHFPRI